MSSSVESHRRRPSEHTPLLGDSDVGEATADTYQDEQGEGDDTASTVVSPIRGLVIGVMASILVLIQGTKLQSE
jgi:hypothetical protein